MTDLEKLIESNAKGIAENKDAIAKNAKAIDELATDNKVILARIEAYQKSSTQVVNLAFSLIVTAVLAILIPAILR